MAVTFRDLENGVRDGGRQGVPPPSNCIYEAGDLVISNWLRVESPQGLLLFQISLTFSSMSWRDQNR